jgi:hypothetical protein
MTESSIVRQNMMDDPAYRGYCGNDISRSLPNGCDNPRTVWIKDLKQFKCPHCGWTSQYPSDFIQRYITKHNLS